MLDGLKSRLKEFLKDEPGSRFQARYERVRSTGNNLPRTVLMMGGGLVVLAAGLVLLPAPGPGMVVVAIGAAMIAQESLVIAKFLDWLELRGHNGYLRLKARWVRWPKVARLAVTIVALLFSTALAAGVLLLSYLVFLK